MSFPMSTHLLRFSDGDVVVSIGQDQYLLHSEAMMTCSPTLAALFKDILSKNAGQPGRMRLVLVAGRSEYGRLAEAKAKNRDEDLETAPEWPWSVRAVWRDILKCMHDQVLEFDDIINHYMIEHCWGLVDVTDNLQMKKDIIAWGINRGTWKLGQRLYFLISQDAVNWMKLARRIRLAWLYQEAIVHVVGQWNDLDEDEMECVHRDTEELCEMMHEELQQEKKLALQAMVEHCPVAHANPGIDRWGCNFDSETHMSVAVSIYRQWLSREIKEHSPLEAADGGAAFFRNIANEKPDNHAEMLDSPTNLDLPSPLAPADVVEIMKMLTRVKGDMKAFVTKFLINKSTYDPDTLGVLPYLTCANINEDDCPWYVTPDTSESSPPTSVGSLTLDNEEAEKEDEVPGKWAPVSPGGPAQAPHDPVNWGIDAGEMDRQLLSDSQLEQILQDIQPVYPGQRPPGEMDIDLEGPEPGVAECEDEAQGVEDLGECEE